ncbi:MAG: ROK family protein [Mongoliibacter sp.]|uniref:ROK family protein n=1 Tax=Mongoliibacter sp. TaxID=2022438 RepID=UPI0012F04988|nr:ROK family protein [Mongoliibacter sp.]TVP46090.1 MAG: ROK family protein [Mongoliibacter sp.]
MAYSKILAGDIGGSHISVALFEKTDSGTSLLRRGRRTVNSLGSKDEILSEWVDLIKEFLNFEDEVVVGLAIPAPFDYEKGVFWIKDQGKFLSLFGIELKKELSQKLQIAPELIYFVNDAEAFLRGESNYGKGVGYENLFGITLGSGLGSSFKIGKKYTDAALWSESFKDGIAEDYLGTAWFVNWAEKNLQKKYSGLKEIIDDGLKAESLKSLFQEYAEHLAEFIYHYDLKYNFDYVVIGGNITKAKHLFGIEVKESLRNLGFNKSIGFSEMGEQSALYGVVATLETVNESFSKPTV